jgi:hypothetical protein
VVLASNVEWMMKLKLKLNPVWINQSQTDINGNIQKGVEDQQNLNLMVLKALSYRQEQDILRVCIFLLKLPVVPFAACYHYDLKLQIDNQHWPFSYSAIFLSGQCHR